jgi:hypothetical protein
MLSVIMMAEKETKDETRRKKEIAQLDFIFKQFGKRRIT